MNTIQTDAVILKMDTLGRVKTPAARRDQVLDEFERSRMSGRQFAEFVGINYQTFTAWATDPRGCCPSSRNNLAGKAPTSWTSTMSANTSPPPPG